MPESPAFEPRIVAFLCNWCSYAGADLAGTSRTPYSPNIRVVRVPCSGRVDPLFVASALRDGADGVLVLGCHPGDCHYADGNYHARRRFAVMRELLLFLGVEAERVKLDWVSASEGARFAKVVDDFTEGVRRLGPRGAPVEHPPSVAPAPAPRRPADGTTAAEATADLRRLAARLLQEQRVDVVLGWEAGTVGLRPFFARSEEQAARLELPGSSSLALATYLRALRSQKVAVVARPGEARACNVLVRERQIRREDLFLIGLEADGSQGSLPASAYDAFLDRGPAGGQAASPVLPALEEMESWPAARRAAYWTAQFDTCLRCYACRQTCPLCYCEECLAEQLAPGWQSIAIDAGEKAFFHTMRAFHLAGRCTGCKACQEACPVDIPLALINRKVAKEVARLFGPCETGLDPARPEPLSMFRRDELLEGPGRA